MPGGRRPGRGRGQGRVLVRRGPGRPGRPGRPGHPGRPGVLGVRDGLVPVRRSRRPGVVEGAGARLVRGAEGRVLAQDALLEVLQLGARVEAELLAEHVAGAAQRLERVGLTSRADQRQGQQRPQPLAQRVPRGQLLEVGGRGGVPAGGQGEAGAVLLGEQAELGQPVACGQRGGMVQQVGVRRAPPAGQCRVERPSPLPRGSRRAARPQQRDGRKPGVHVLDDRDEPLGVQRPVGQVQGVPARRAEEHLRRRARRPVGLEGAAQAGDVRLQRGRRRGRRPIAPDQVDQLVDAHARAGSEG